MQGDSHNLNDFLFAEFCQLPVEEKLDNNPGNCRDNAADGKINHLHGRFFRGIEKVGDLFYRKVK